MAIDDSSSMTYIASLIISFLSVLFFVVCDVVLHILVLFQEQPEHSTELFGWLDLHFLVTLHAGDFFLQILDAGYLMVWELALVCHQVVVGTHKVLLQLIVESLSRDLHADAQNNLDVHDLLFQGCI